MGYAFFLAYYSILLFSEVSPIILFTQPIILLLFLQQYNYSTYYINVRKLYTIQNSTIYYTVINTTVSSFTRDTLINVHDAYMTIKLYNTYYICVILHARSRMLQVY